MRNQSYTNFWQRIHKSAKKNNLPLRVMFELTYRCNFYCKHCYVPLSYREKTAKELNTKEIFRILDQLKDIGCFYLGFTGGEPLIRKDIIEIFQYAKRCGFEIIIYTNGSLIDDKIAKRLSCLRPNKVDITIPAMSKDVFDHISGVSGSRHKVFRAIDLLYKNGVNLGFKTCALKKNEREIEEIQKFADSLDALHRLDAMLMPRLDASKEPYRYQGRLFNNANLRKSNANLREFSEANYRECLNEDIGVNLRAISKNSHLFKCGIGVNQAAITPLGELKMCSMIDYPKYKILESSLKDAWQRLKELVDNIRPDENYKCDNCELRNFCKWCPARAWLHNGTFTSCEPESLAWAGHRHQILTYGKG